MDDFLKNVGYRVVTFGLIFGFLWLGCSGACSIRKETKAESKPTSSSGSTWSWSDLWPFGERKATTKKAAEPPPKEPEQPRWKMKGWSLDSDPKPPKPQEPGKPEPSLWEQFDKWLDKKLNPNPGKWNNKGWSL